METADPAISTVPFALVVDDDALIVMHACDIMEDAGFRALEAHDAEEAFGVLEKLGDGVTLLFTDVEMTGMDGFELARAVNQRWPEIEIVVASGAIVPGPGAMPSKATFIRKPFSGDIVKHHLAETLPDHKKPEPLKRAM